MADEPGRLRRRDDAPSATRTIGRRRMGVEVDERAMRPVGTGRDRASLRVAGFWRREARLRLA